MTYASRMFLVLLMTALLLTGCWSKAELNEGLFIDGIYLDKGQKEGQVQLSISSFITAKLKDGEASGKPFTVVTKSGDNIPDVLTSIQKDLTRRIDFSHVQVVLVAEEYARLGLGELFDWFKREPGVELNTYILSVKGEASNIAQLTPITEQLPSEVFKRFSVQNYMLNSTVRHCLIAAESGMGFAMTALNYGDQKVASENGEKELWAGIKGIDVFGDRALKGELSIDQGRAISWGLGKFRDQVYSVNWDEGRSTGSVLITRVHPKLIYKGDQDGPLFKIVLKGRGNLVYKKDMEHRSNAESNEIIMELLGKRVVKDMEKALAKTQQWGADVLNLGMLMEWNSPEEWQAYKDQWPEVYRSKAQFEIDADISISNQGSMR
ncbi:Ger(x)C family spore germination protein [Paenibacillus physcomitrellae]|uniref:Uncharacterized protein n=1 Tax=Paenibacillus physcomitrellae TaxID=1619311 RepID=A0ABQ1GPC0_9BACL|nr:Ger(x)C family spore germination protein [Paenibacillus physcomitrellae]GGA47524.1 hypothetical protein GCM10010917_36010 [Paenibacillus physcomitrellae]